MTPLIAVYGEEGTCWEEFGEDACWLDCRARKKALAKVAGSDPACRECESGEDCSVWGEGLVCNSAFECVDATGVASLCSRYAECCGDGQCRVPGLGSPDDCEVALLSISDGCEAEIAAVAECGTQLDCDTYTNWLALLVAAVPPDTCESPSYDWQVCAF